ncbi:MAG TPA: SRPBCC domain-containing protein [Candidatus Deferrimicrobiaceae bacterium]|nr:SRPBCC domain-containing protein [Candidatus Deferrimicrobiaceae bacterium]
MADVAKPSAQRGTPKETTRTVRMRRRLTASPERVFRAFSDPEELARWFPEGVEGGLAVGSRTTLVWPRRRLWWEVVEATPSRRFIFRWPWGDADSIVTTVTIDVRPSGYGTLLDLEDGPFPIDSPDGLDAWAAGLEGWGEALAMLRAHLDFSVDLRPLV